MNKTPDPERYVDEFQALVDEWQEWHRKWDDWQKDHQTTRGGNFLSRKHATKEFLTDATKFLETQAKINTMMLAAIDELKKR